MNELCDAPHPRHGLEIPLQLQHSRLWSPEITCTAGSRPDWQPARQTTAAPEQSPGTSAAPTQPVALPFSLGARAGCGKTHRFGKPFKFHGLGLTISHPCRSHVISLKFRYRIPQPLASILSSALQTPRWCGWPPPICAVLLVPWHADKEASISRLRGGFTLAVDELTAVLIRFTKSLGIKVLSKYKMIKIQLYPKTTASLVFPFLAGKPMTLVKLWARSQEEDDFSYVS